MNDGFSKVHQKSTTPAARRKQKSRENDALTRKARDREWASLQQKRETQGRPRHFHFQEAELFVLSASKCQATTACLLNSVVAGCFGDPSSWSMRTLDQILDAGFRNYHLVRRSHGLPDGSYLETGHLDNPQHAIRLTAGNVLVTIDPWSFSGNYGAPIDDGERVCSTVCVGLHRMLELYDRGIVFIANQWMAVFRVGAEYFIFNPHPIGPAGHHQGGPVRQSIPCQDRRKSCRGLASHSNKRLERKLRSQWRPSSGRRRRRQGLW